MRNYYLDDDTQIAECIREFKAHGFSLTMLWVRSLAWQFAYINGFPGVPLHTNILSRTWAQGFLKCFPHLTCRKAVNLSVARAMAANEPNVRTFFAEYEKVLADLGINSPEQIWSGDEMGIQNVPKEDVVAIKGKKTRRPDCLCRSRRNFYCPEVCEWSWESSPTNGDSQRGMSPNRVDLRCASRSAHCHYI